MIELICLDIDGTLVGSSGLVSPDVWTAAAAARRRGVRIAICSGRPAFGVARGFAERLDGDGWHIFQNGASVVHFPGGEARSTAIPTAVVRELIARARRTGRLLELYTDTEYAVELDVPAAREHAALLGVPFAPRSLDSLAPPIVRAQWIASHAEGEVIVAEPHVGLTVSPSLSPLMPESSFLNVTPEGVDKGLAVRVLAEEYGIPLEKVMMVGDSANDLPALRIVGTSVAMGNSEPPIKAVARHVVGDVDHGGLVEAFALAASLG
jgi:Cof subfamily protein (haloacid dehalogenase superfamily)